MYCRIPRLNVKNVVLGRGRDELMGYPEIVVSPEIFVSPLLHALSSSTSRWSVLGGLVYVTSTETHFTHFPLGNDTLGPGLAETFQRLTDHVTVAQWTVVDKDAGLFPCRSCI